MLVSNDWAKDTYSMYSKEGGTLEYRYMTWCLRCGVHTVQEGHRLVILRTNQYTTRSEDGTEKWIIRLH